MRAAFRLTLLLLFFLLHGSAESGPRAPVNIYILRGGEQLNAPHVVTYRVFEWTQMRGRWIIPDFGYYDTGYGQEQIWFTGAGASLVRSRHFDWDQELYFSQEAGPLSENKRSLWIWPVVDLRVAGHFSAQIAAYPTLPLDRAQRWGYDVDRAKLEHAIGNRWLAGVGYAGGVVTDRSWQSKPFLTVTRRTRGGNFEVWLQKIPGGSQAQVRWLLVTGDH